MTERIGILQAAKRGGGHRATLESNTSSVKMQKRSRAVEGASPNEDTPEPLLLLRIEERSA
ncbi:MAG: hypothetical protein O2960_12960, partial [Verrucomicrobia bacterium]|nr:hypothetical protein [Verrucomicrobiota bacterium]